MKRATTPYRLLLQMGVAIVSLSLLPLSLPQDAFAGRSKKSASKKARDRKARALYKAGDAHYAAGRYKEAVEAFQRAYELSKRSALLYNLANAHERLGNPGQAAQYLRQYLKGRRVRGRDLVAKRAARLEQLHQQKLAEKKKREQEEKKRAEERRAAEQAKQALAAKRAAELKRAEQSRLAAARAAAARRSRWPAYLTLGAAAAAAAAGVTLAVLSNGAAESAVLGDAERL
jgi:tetratricopeptide (TPR) repeat protein